MNPNILLPLPLLRSGEAGDIADIAGEPGWVGRMAEVGLRIGCRVQVLQQGSPCLLQLDGCRLTLRGDTALQILVRPVAG